jgi:hypothetical protein
MGSPVLGADRAPRPPRSCRRVLVGFGGLVVATVTGCSSSPRSLEATGTEGATIIGGTLATSYPESTFVDLYAKGSYIAACSGAMIAPIVAITAAHCITGVPGSVPDSWVVTAPYAGKTPTRVFGTAVYDYTGGTDNITPTQHDVGLLFLDTPVMLSSYPTIATTELMDGSEVVNVGRMNNGVLSTTDMYVSPNVAVMDGSEITPPFPYDYAAMDVIESGDSGGPDEVPGMTPHLIVAVNSGDGMGTEVLARTDPVNTWITMEVMTHMTPPAMDAGVDSAPPPVAADSGAPPAEDSGGIPSLSGPPPGEVAFPNTSKGCAVAGVRSRDGARDPASPPVDAAWLALGAALLWRGKRRRS